MPRCSVCQQHRCVRWPCLSSSFRGLRSKHGAFDVNESHICPEDPTVQILPVACRQRLSLNESERALAIRKAFCAQEQHCREVFPLNTIAPGAFRELQSAREMQGAVFLNIGGNPLCGPRDWFEPALLKARIAEYTGHCSRHPFASRLVVAGVDIRAVAQLLRHSTISDDYALCSSGARAQ